MWEYRHSDELKHYGVLGMKWGVRRYQNKDGTLTSAGRKRYDKQGKGSEATTDTKSPNAKPTVDTKSVTQFVKDRGSQKAGALSDNAKLGVVYAATFITYIATMYGAMKLSEKSFRNRKNKELEELNASKKIKSFKDAPKLSRKMTASDSMKKTNPDYPKQGTTMNCTFCTTALALRERGYDVKAAKSIDGWYTDDLFKKTFNSPTIKMDRKTNSDSLLKNLASNGNGAYGNLTVNWKLGGAHSVFWKNEGGKTRIYDGQSGDELTSSKKTTDEFMKNIRMNNITYNRLDNVRPTQYALAIVESNK